MSFNEERYAWRLMIINRCHYSLQMTQYLLCYRREYANWSSCCQRQRKNIDMVMHSYRRQCCRCQSNQGRCTPRHKPLINNKFIEILIYVLRTCTLCRRYSHSHQLNARINCNSIVREENPCNSKACVRRAVVTQSQSLMNRA